MLFSVSLSQARIIRVNNNAGISADFASLQQAIDSATAGDTIYIEPSSTSYGTITLNKRLNLYGPGYFLAENSGQQANVNTSKIDFLTINGSSAFSSITGLQINQYIDLYVGNIAITRCYFTSTSFCFYFSGTTSNTNVLIAQNFMNGTVVHSGGTQTYTVFFRNNYIAGNLSLEPSIVCDFTNNVLGASSSSGVQNSIFVNNIFFTTSTAYNPGLATYNNGFEHNIFRNNTTSVDTTAAGAGNYTGVNTNNVFQGNTNNSTDGSLRIIPGSIADGNGKEIPAGTPTDIGMFGGPNPYKLSGVPAIPTIYDLVVPTSNTTGGLNVTIRAKSQD